MTLVIISFLVIAAYTAAVCVKQKGVPYSISATFYKLQHPYWFMAAMWATAGLLMPTVLETSKPGTEFLAFLACAGMLFVGAAPNFREDLEGKVHMSGAVMCVAFSQLWLVFNCPWFLILWIVLALYIVSKMCTNEITGDIKSDFVSTKPMFWVEITALVTTYITTLILSV